MRMIDACALQEEYKTRHSGKRLLLIDVAPTVDAVPVRHGRWIPCRPLGDGTPEGYMCSVCHVGGWEKTNFCPECGADMRKDDDHNED